MSGIYQISPGKTQPKAATNKEMAEILRFRHFRNDQRFQSPNGSIEDRRNKITYCLDKLRSGQSHAVVAGTISSASAFSIAIMLDGLERAGIMKKAGMTPETLLDRLHAKDESAYHPTQSRFWFLEALIEEGVVSSSYIDKSIKPTMSIPTARDVISIISEKTGISAERIKSPERSYDVVSARFFAIFILRKVSLLSLCQIGKCIGDRDHTTIMNSLEQMKIRVFSDAGEAISALELCNIIDMIGQKKYFEFLKNQNNPEKMEKK